MNQVYLNNFKPTQGEKLWPDIKQQSTIYREYLPCRELQPYVACYWTSKTINSLNNPIYSRIIPDGCIDIIFNIEEINSGKSAIVCGLMTAPEVEKINGVREFIGIRFWAGGVIPFLRNSANDFTDQLIPLDSILGKTKFNISEKLYSSDTLTEKIAIIEEELKNLLLKASKIDVLIKSALYTIYKHKGIISIGNLSKELNISQRQLSRKFNSWIGTNPKTFCNIVRFQYIVRKLNGKTNINLRDLAFENGYYDQAHFIKEFKTFYGKTPGQL